MRIGSVSSMLRVNVTTAVGSVAPGLTNSNRPSIASGVFPSFRSFTTAESFRISTAVISAARCCSPTLTKTPTDTDAMNRMPTPSDTASGSGSSSTVSTHQ